MLIWNYSHELVTCRSIDPKEPLKEDEDEKAFNSGEPVPAGTFLYSFEEPGVYTVVSPSGAPGLIGKINVVDSGE